MKTPYSLLIIVFTFSIINAAKNINQELFERKLYLNVGISGVRYNGHLSLATGNYIFEDTYAGGLNLGLTYRPIGPHTLNLWAIFYSSIEADVGASFLYGRNNKKWGIGPVVGLYQDGFIYGMQTFYKTFGIRIYLARQFIEYEDNLSGVKFINRQSISFYYDFAFKRFNSLINNKKPNIGITQ
jgi:hypothetical protein